MFIKHCLCNYNNVNEPVLELVTIENSTFNKNFKCYKTGSCSLVCNRAKQFSEFS